MTIAISSVLAFDIHGTPEVCCDTKYYTLASEAKQLVKDLKAGKVDGEHHWFENGDTIWESSGATFSGKERADRLQKIIDKCTTDDGISVAGHDCLYDSNASTNSMCLYKGPQAGCDFGNNCLDLHWNKSKCHFPISQGFIMIS
ncbi:hypothetical protein WALSEDRAFT_61374 [Wallemia mellicola CBS 633.66]|uniref:Uncharacterized protein n=1 Tax=Wallemia mellicola (strain ATCC MYA-4683 / CBS 633.66) TaxID=671144 RepID=I4Y6Q7_WALMC|nr:hypothetical protein WALSEDRAFT_61374 [Wallemia mellicola CBS 633.66]EIM19649.1 hypothetical protein WALSEDRAFT_61374 [Wallemia mellicola CBS 633.66]|eukprot:XP_006960312.1 hypothetical protein WALSEDRAFT_61374 [Wallemia mellicola CBS 633.66]